MEKEALQKKGKRGFAAMDSGQQREIAAKGGRVAHERGVAHEWSRDEAKQAGRKGGLVSGKRRSLDRTEDDGCDHIL